MNTRKIIGFGKDSYVISLPKKWVNNNNLKKGDSVYVTDLPFELKITPAETAQSKQTITTVIDTKNKDIKLIKTEIITAYLNHSDIIEVRGNNINTYRKEIKEIINNLSGMEIIEIDANKIIAKDLIDIREVSIPVLIKRIDMNLRSMLDDFVKSDKVCTANDEIMERDKDINRMVFLSYRTMKGAILNPAQAMKLNITYEDLIIKGLIILRLEKIGDQIKRITRAMCTKICEKKHEHIKCAKLHELFTNVRAQYLDVMKAYYNNDRELAFKIEVGSHKLIGLANNFLEKNPTIENARIIEHTKSMISSVKHISRSLVGGIG